MALVRSDRRAAVVNRLGEHCCDFSPFGVRHTYRQLLLQLRAATCNCISFQPRPLSTPCQVYSQRGRDKEKKKESVCWRRGGGGGCVGGVRQALSAF